ncbi:hypothetical protein [Streptococcus oralis]|uniref:hypothetical protein n=1 Tax=Streptococcus TaxID=1301 RepID=UPI0019D03C87|nr:hypothetical protein [Streptococcus oralis]MBN6013084.1 hypothetical protein [Streptococcus oralis subsp. oralis]
MAEWIEQSEVAFWSISKQTNLNQDQGKKELYKYGLALINYKILSRYEGEI